MDTRNPPTAQLTVPTTAAQAEGADKPDTAANTAVTTDGFKDDGETTADQVEDDSAAAAATTEDEVKEGDQQQPETVKEVKPYEWYHGDDAAPDAQSEPLDTVDSFFKEVEAKRKGKKEGETKEGEAKEGETKEAAKDGDAW